MEVRNVIKCSVCKSFFSTKYNMRKHVKKFHADQINIVAPRKSYNFRCDDCNRNFTHLRHLKYHRRKKHEELSSDPALRNKHCPLCDFCGRQTTELMDHFTKAHKIEIKTSSHNFASLEDFNTWKIKIENDSKSHYVKRRGAVVVNTRQSIDYACHRSGNFNSRSKGLRKLKNKGSNKIGGFCPANIKVTVLENGACDVKFSSTHIGHENDLGHLALSPSEREALAAKIARKVSFTNILNEVRDSFQNTQAERIHLLTRKDLHNIKRSFNLQSVCHESESLSDEEEELIIDCEVEKSPTSLDDLKNNSVVEEVYIYESTSLADEKEKLKDIVFNLIDDISSIEEVEDIKKMVLQISSTLNTAKRKDKTGDETQDQTSVQKADIN